MFNVSSIHEIGIFLFYTHTHTERERERERQTDREREQEIAAQYSTNTPVVVSGYSVSGYSRRSILE